MPVNSRAIRLLKALNLLSTKSTFDNITVLKKINLQTASEGSIRGTFTVDTSMCNIGGSLHGGYISSVTDVLSFYTLLTNQDGRLSWTTSMNVNYVGSVFEGEQVNVETITVKSGNSAVVETYFHNEKGNLLAKGTTAFLAAPDRYQKIIKDCIDFDVYEN